MTLERRNGHVYLYESRRVGKRVRKKYVASGYMATLIVRYDALRAEQRKLARWQQEDRLARWAERADRIGKLLDRANGLVADALRAAGWHQHKREWRKRRGATMT